MAGQYSIVVPNILADLLKGHTHNRLVENVLASFDEWFYRNDMIFFREYTDHGIKHITDVLNTSCALITNEARKIFSPADAALLIASTVLHDCALHLQEQSFISLVSDNPSWQSTPIFKDTAWSNLWRKYVSESNKLSVSQLKDIFGSDTPIDAPALDRPENWTPAQYLYIGEFLRRNHPRLAYEIAYSGVPGANGVAPLSTIKADDPLHYFVHLAGLVARSHGFPLRTMLGPLSNQFHIRKFGECHPLYVMTLLRLADFLQIQPERAPGGVLRVKGLRSPKSRSEWALHEAIQSINYDQHADPEVVEVIVNPKKTSINTFLKIKKLFSQIQEELDTSWAVLGEVFGRYNEKSLGLTIRRLRSNIDDIERFGQAAGYIPERVEFTAANAELLKLLIKPLYGDYPEIAVRELVQNAVDACRERRYLEAQRGTTFFKEAQVSVSIKINTDNSYSLIIEDNGIGMSLDTIRSYFLNAGASYRTSMSWKTTFEVQRGKAEVLRSGRFGVGSLAAFLIADDPSQVRLRVESRHLDAAPHEGLRFEAPLTDEPISVQQCTLKQVGTRIEVITGSAPAFMRAVRKEDENVHKKWDWYCLEWPTVLRRTASSETLQQSTVLPERPENSSLKHHWLSPDGYEQLSWTYVRAPHVVCNGIIVIEQGKAGVPPIIKQSTKLVDLEINMPNISIFDKNGTLPLTLDRLRVDFSRLTFIDIIREDVMRNIIAYLLVFAPEAIMEGGSERILNKPRHSSSAVNISADEMAWMFHGNNVALCEPAIMKELKIYHVVELARRSDMKFVEANKRIGEYVIALCRTSVCGKLIANSDILERARHCVVSADTSIWEELEREVFRVVRNVEDSVFYRNRLHEVGVSHNERRGKREGRYNREENIENSDVYVTQDWMTRLLGGKRWKRDGERIGTSRETLERMFSVLAEYERPSDVVSKRKAIEEIERVVFQRVGNAGSGRVGRIIDEVFETMKRQLRQSNIISGELLRVAARVIEMLERGQPKLSTKDIGVFDSEKTLVKWSKIGDKAGGDKWFISEYVMEQGKTELEAGLKLSVVAEAWRKIVGEFFVPAEYNERREKLAGIWKAPEMEKHFAEWDAVRQELASKA